MLYPFWLLKTLTSNKYQIFPNNNQNVSFWNTNFFFIFWSFVLFRAAPAAYGGSQARGLVGAIATGPTPEPQQ